VILIFFVLVGVIMGADELIGRVDLRIKDMLIVVASVWILR